MSGANRYVTIKNATASKERLMVNLFETALRHMRVAMQHLEKKDRRAANVLLDKSSQIIAYLHGTLKRDAAPAMVDTLAELYTFTLARLLRAIVTGKTADVREAERAFAPIVEGFQKAVATMSGPAAQGARP